MILIALGANLPSRYGPPEATLRAAVAEFANASLGVRAVAPFYRSFAWPDPGDPPFVNSVTEITSQRDPINLLSKLKEMERSFGREPGARNAPRVLDLDLIDFDGRVAEGPPTLPHPRLHERGFVLVPLYDIAPLWRHPVSGKSVSELIDALPPEARALTRLA